MRPKVDGSAKKKTAAAVAAVLYKFHLSHSKSNLAIALSVVWRFFVVVASLGWSVYQLFFSSSSATSSEEDR